MRDANEYLGQWANIMTLVFSLYCWAFTVTHFNLKSNKENLCANIFTSQQIRTVR